jgi:hypothetical protein
VTRPDQETHVGRTPGAGDRPQHDDAHAPPSASVAAAALTALLAIPTTYALLRARDALFFVEPDPATVAWSAHIAMFWRLAVSFYVGGMAAPLAFIAARADLTRTFRFLSTAVVVVAVLVGAQGIFLP